MTDDLVKRLRDLGDHASFEPHMHHTAADRIEQLEAERDAAIAALTQIERTYYMEATNPSPETIRKMAARMNGIARDAQDAIRAQTQESDK